MKVTYKVKHNRDFSRELGIARKVAEMAISKDDLLTTKDVKHLGLSSVISGRILWKYGRNKKIKKIHSVPLTIDKSHTRMTLEGLWIPCLKLLVPIDRDLKVGQIEVTKDYVFISHEVVEVAQYKQKTHIGVDLNTTGHCAVVAVKETGKVYKLGKKAEHTHKKYKHIRKNLQKKGLYAVVKKVRDRESRIVRDLNHKTSRFIVDLAIQQKGGIQLESLKGIRNRKTVKSFKYALNSWSFYQLGKFIEYKALLAGVPLTYIDPAYTSKSCSRCGLIGTRTDKHFKCPKGHVENADVNAAFNIAVLSNSILKLQADRDASKGVTATPQRDRAIKQANPKVVNQQAVTI